MLSDKKDVKINSPTFKIRKKALIIELELHRVTLERSHGGVDAEKKTLKFTWAGLGHLSECNILCTPQKE